jgi:hypothetical protein
MGGAGAAALAAQLFATGLIAGNPSEARVDEDGVRGRLLIMSEARDGSGLSIREVRIGAGNRVGSPDNALYTLRPCGEESVRVADCCKYALGAPYRLILDSRKSPTNFLVLYGRDTSSFSNGTPSRRITLLTMSDLSEHSSSVRA